MSAERGRTPRLEPRAEEAIDRAKSARFEFNGRSIPAYEGDTIASALYAAGTRIFSRSFKYHRVRGLLCVAGNCPNCLMTVDGAPNARACVTRVQEGMRVQGQNAWPGLEKDMLSIIDRLDWALPIGFYYKALHRPRALWKLSASVIRRLGGLGRAGGDDSLPPARRSYAHADVAVVGGGVAGMSAALAAARQGSRVTLIDDAPSLGGRLLYASDMEAADASGAGAKPGALAAAVVRERGIRVLSNSTAFGLYEGNLLGVHAPDGATHLRARQVVVCAGAQEQPLIFDRNDLAGVMLSTGLQRLINLYRVKPGNSALVATTNDAGYHAALTMLDAGMRIVAVADTRPRFRWQLPAAQALRSRGALILPNHAIVRAEGTRTVIGGVVAELDEDGGVSERERQFDCEIIAMSGGFQPSTALLQQAGAEFATSEALGELVPTRLPPSVHAAGDVTSIRAPHIAALQGERAGRMSAQAAAGREGSTDAEDQALALAEAEYRAALDPEAGPISHPPAARQFICYCEDVLTKDIAQGVAEGFRDVQTLKRYSTVTMGPCQGKMCHRRFTERLSELTGEGMDKVRMTTSRPPVQPVTLGALAGPMHLPFKRTPLHRRHIEANATIVETGGWQRPHSYGDPQREALSVRERVGIIDVGTLGKLDLRGEDAPELLDFVYTHRLSDLRAGRLRYGILTSDNGSIMDDGTVARISADRYYVTTSTSNVESVEQWFQWWLAERDMCAHVVNVTAGYSAINVAGPRARQTLSRITDVDLSPDRFRYLRVRRGKVAGVPSLLLRLGFVGETGWEIHCPSEYGERVWDALLIAGADFGIQPFGLEAQRILRLEKMHVIPGQDTDLLTTPFDIGADWAVKFDKGDFVGAGGLRAASERGARDRLVGFVMLDETIPRDGDSVVSDDNRPIGRITSSRLSPTMRRGFGFARVPVRLAEEGRTLCIWSDGARREASVTLRPFYDPKGERLRA